MSFADGLAHERADKDAKTREKVRYVIRNLGSSPQVPGDIGAREGKYYSISAFERKQIVRYLTEYANGNQLR